MPPPTMKNEPKTNPISQKPKMTLNLYSTKDYDNNPPLRATANEPKTNPIQTQFPIPQSPHASQLPAAEIRPSVGQVEQSVETIPGFMKPDFDDARAQTQDPVGALAEEILVGKVIFLVDVCDSDDAAELFYSIVFLADSPDGLCLATTDTAYGQQDCTKIVLHLIWAKLFFAASMVFSISSGVWASETNIAS